MRGIVSTRRSVRGGVHRGGARGVSLRLAPGMTSAVALRCAMLRRFALMRLCGVHVFVDFVG